MMNIRYTVRSAVILIAFSAVLDLNAGAGQEARPVRVLSVTTNGPIVVLRLADGRTVEVAESDVRIRNRSRKSEARDQKLRYSVDDLRQVASGANGMTAVARVVQRADGRVRKVKIIMFASEAETVAFLNRKPVESKPAQ